MDHTAIEKFESYHNDQSSEGVRLSSNSPHAPGSCIEDDFREDGASLSGSAHHSSGPDEAVFDSNSRHSSPRTSHSSEDELEDSYLSQKQPSSPFAPLKTRSPFRAPSSVRAMQTDTTPPRLSLSSSQQRPRIHTAPRQGTPRSVRSNHSAIRTPSKLSPGKKLKKEYPLVLLHVTLLPLPPQYSSETLKAILSPTILANWKLLEERITQTVLERGVLIPHPREDYDLLEERLLETLELKQPRILKCGHFHLSPEEEADVLAEDSEGNDSDAEDIDKCQDCGRRIRDGRSGDAGTGNRRWDIKIFAANGLMKAGAWSAAWREMERVDVEILPWMEDKIRQELELRREEEERHVVEKQQAASEEGVGGLDDERLREIYGQNAHDYVQGLGYEESSHLSAARTPDNIRFSPPPPAERQHKQEIPLLNLLKNYLIVAAQDRRNLAILLLSLIVLFMSIRGLTTVPPSVSLQPREDVISAAGISMPELTAYSSTAEPLPATTEEVPSKPAVSETEETGAATVEERTPIVDDSDENIMQEIMED